MAEKRITTVNEMQNPDADADYLMVVRGTQQDLRRLLMRRLPTAFDLHDDISDELTTLGGVDRLAISDEGNPGAPQKFVKLSTLRSFLLDLFDLHDDVPTELTTAADADRLLISDESETGDPQKFITVENLGNSFTGLAYELLATEYNYRETFLANNVEHTLGRPPRFAFPVLICKGAENGYSVGDEVQLGLSVYHSATGQRTAMAIVAASATRVTVAFGGTDTNSRSIVFPHKTSGTPVRAQTNSNWKVKIALMG